MNITLASIQQAVGGKIDGDANLSIHGVNDLRGASNDEITFAESERNLKQAESTGAGAVVVPVDFPALPGKSLLRSARPKETFVRIMLLFNPPQRPINGVHPDACIAPEAKLGQNVAVAERAVLRPGVQVGDNTVIESGAHLGRDVTIGADCLIGPNVVLYPGTRLGDRVRIQAGTVIGGDGFGNLWTGEQHQKIPQLGTVVIEDDVEIGSNVCIDRATFGETRIRRDVKIDNLVQVAHNNDIGEHSILVALVGLAGSVTLGKRVTLGGQTGVADHVNIGDEVIAAARTGITKNIPSGQIILGFPSRPIKQARKEIASMSRLPPLIQQVRKLELRLQQLEEQLLSGDAE